MFAENKTYRPHMEALEDRFCLSAAPMLPVPVEMPSGQATVAAQESTVEPVAQSERLGSEQTSESTGVFLEYIVLPPAEDSAADSVPQDSFSINFAKIETYPAASLGGDGADVLRGGAGNDTLPGNRGNDVVLGQDGNDLLIVNNGDGSDFLENAEANRARPMLFLNCAAGAHVAESSGNDTIPGNRNYDPLIGGDGADVLRGGAGQDNQVPGQDGNDLLIVNNGDGSASLEAQGLDVVVAATTTDVALEQDGNDLLIGSNGDSDSVEGGDGADVLRGGAGNDTQPDESDKIKPVLMVIANQD